MNLDLDCRFFSKRNKCLFKVNNYDAEIIFELT